MAIFFVGAGENNGLNANVYSIYIDTLNQGDATFGMTTITNQQSNALNNATCFFLTDTAPSAASHTFDVRWRVLAGTGTVRVGRIWAWEIG